MKISSITFFTIFLITGFSCSEEIKPKPFQYSEIFSGKNSKTWVLKSIKLVQAGKSDINYSLANCVKDDRHIFYANAEKLFEVTNGSTKCSSDEPDLIISDTWSFVNASATLNMTFPILAEFSLPYIVKKVDKKSMTLEIYLDEEGTVSYQMTFDSIAEN